MNLDNLTPDTSSKLSFFLIIIIMGIFGFIQDFVFNANSSGNLTPIFLISFTFFSGLVYLNYRFKEYRDFYMIETTNISNPVGFFVILVVLIFFVVTPNSLIKVVGIKTWIFIFSLVILFILSFLIAGIIKYKKLIKGLINDELKTFNSTEDDKIKKFILNNKDELTNLELINKLNEFGYNKEHIRLIVNLLAYEFPLI